MSTSTIATLPSAASSSTYPIQDQPSSRFSIPTIDITPYYTSPLPSTLLPSPAAHLSTIITQIREACLSTGFFQLLGHGVPRELQEAVFRGAEAFFALSEAEKGKLDIKAHGGGRGYEVLASQILTSPAHSTTTVAAEMSLPDRKEGFYFGRDVPSSHPLVQKGVFLIGPNHYPSSSILSDVVFKDVMETYYEKMLELSGVILGLIAAGFEDVNEVDGFEGIYDQEGRGGGEDIIATLRLLHYPPSLPSSSSRCQLGAGPHTDFGFITLLMQDSIGGLEVLDPSCTSSPPTSPAEIQKQEQIWHAVAPNPDAYVVNVGDMLQMFTRGRFKSSVHRVVMAEDGRGQDRYSVPFFFDGRAGFVLRRYGADEDGDVMTVEAYMRERFKKTYGS